MKNHIRRYNSVLAALLALLLPAAGRAFELKPMTQTFEPTGGSINRTFTVQNDRDEEVAVSVTIKARSLNASGGETLKDTGDFAIFPTQILLKGNSSQVIRVQWQGAQDLRSEQAYRIIAEEVPLKSSPALSQDRSMSIKLILRFGGTIYVAPPEAKSDVVLASAKAVKTPKGEVLELVMENRGSRHAIIDHPSLRIKTGKDTSLLLQDELDKTLGGENILAGASRTISLPCPEGLPVGPVDAKLNASYLQ